MYIGTFGLMSYCLSFIKEAMQLGCHFIQMQVISELPLNPVSNMPRAANSCSLEGLPAFIIVQAGVTVLAEREKLHGAVRGAAQLFIYSLRKGIQLCEEYCNVDMK